MGFFAFLGRHVLAAIVGAVGILLAALGYADQAGQIVTSFEPWQLQATGAALFVIAVVRILYQYDRQHQVSELPARIIHDAPQAERGEPLAPFAAPDVPLPATTSERVFVSPNLSPGKLMAMCAGKSTHRGQLLVAPYIGKWLRVSGTIEDITIHESQAFVRFDRSTMPALAGVESPTVHSIRLTFKSQFDRLEILEGGELMIADGKITEIDSLSLRLDCCEIVSVESP